MRIVVRDTRRSHLVAADARRITESDTVVTIADSQRYVLCFDT
jgi:hypothetical protein